ncbi:unnamed protein product, partial [Iphiclides podalirius]
MVASLGVRKPAPITPTGARSLSRFIDGRITSREQRFRRGRRHQFASGSRRGRRAAPVISPPASPRAPRPSPVGARPFLPPTTCSGDAAAEARNSSIGSRPRAIGPMRGRPSVPLAGYVRHKNASSRMRRPVRASDAGKLTCPSEARRSDLSPLNYSVPIS